MTNFESQLASALAGTINEMTVPRRLGIMGFENEDGTWDVVVPNSGPRVYVTVDEGRVTAINTVAPLIIGFPVSVAYYPGREPVIDRIDSFAAAEFMKNKYYTGVAPHSHRFTSGNPDFIEPMRYEPGLVVPDSSGALIVRALPFFYSYNNAWSYYGGSTIDLTSHRPSTASKKRWVLIGVAPATGTLQATSGSDYAVDADMPISAIASITYSGIRLAAIILTTGQTAAPVVSTDYVDTRDWFTGGAASSPLTVKEADGAPNVAAVTEIRVTNGTLTDVGSGVVSINTGGTPLTVKEVDGTPVVNSVGTIRVTNGTLTDDGGGQVTISTGGSGINTIFGYQNNFVGDNTSSDVTITPVTQIDFFDMEVVDNLDGTVTVGSIYWPEFYNIVGRNLLINGAFEQWKHGAAGANAYFTAPTNDTVTADRWRVQKNTSAVVDIYPVNYTIPYDGAPVSFTALEAKVTTADATIGAGEYYTICQNIEGYIARSLLAGNGGSYGRWWDSNLVVSFMVRSDIAGFFSVALTSATGRSSVVGEYEITSGEIGDWVQKTVYLEKPYSDTLDMDLENGLALKLHFTLAAGSDYHEVNPYWSVQDILSKSTQTNFLATVNNKIAFAAVKMELGWRVRTFYQEASPDENVRLCERYFFSDYWGYAGAGSTVTSGETYFIAVSTSKLVGTFRFPSEMRDVPTVTIYASDGTADAVTSTGGTTTGAAATAARINRRGFCEITDAGAPYTAGEAYRFMVVADAEI